MSYAARFVSFRGRTDRVGWWRFQLWSMTIMAILIFAFINIDTLAIKWVTGAIAVISYCVSSLAVTTRRLHDRNKSAIWLLLVVALPITAAGVAMRLGQLSYPMMSLAAVINVWFIVELGLLRGTVGDNRFGADPATQHQPT